MTKILARLLAFACLFAVTVHAADRVKVKLGDIESQNARAGEAEVVKALVRSELRNEGSFQLTTDADTTLSGSLIRLESAYLIQLRIEREDHPTVSRQARAGNLDEMDVAVRRVVKALAENVSVENTVRRGEVLERERELPSRVQSIKGYEAFVGFGFPLFETGGSKPLLGDFSFGHAWDVRRFLLELRGDALFAINGDGVGSITGVLGAAYFLTEGSTASMFLGGEFGFGIGFVDWSNPHFGMSFGGNIGAVFLREADVNLDLRLRVSAIANSMGASDAIPVFMTILAGLHF